MRFNRDLRGWGIMDECETEKKDISRKKKKKDSILSRKEFLFACGNGSKSVIDQNGERYSGGSRLQAVDTR